MRAASAMIPLISTESDINDKVTIRWGRLVEFFQLMVEA